MGVIGCTPCTASEEFNPRRNTIKNHTNAPQPKRKNSKKIYYYNPIDEQITEIEEEIDPKT